MSGKLLSINPDPISWLASLCASAPLSTTDLQSIIDSAGRQSALIENIWWIFFWVLFAVYVLVLVFLGWALVRRRRYPPGVGTDEARPAPLKLPQERKTTLAVSIAVGATVVILFGLLLAEFFTGRKLHALAANSPDSLEIKITAQQWWWEIQYQDDLSSNIVTTANEVHIPLSQPVKFLLESKDVIHSFWVPNLNGKRDAIPGYTTDLWLRADVPGTYWGQCAEFCGHQHAHMRFKLIAQDPEDFKSWLTAQRQSAPPPQTESQQRGQELFLRSSCAMCHTVSGTPARGTIGPNLTHVASRSTIAAGTLKNNRGNLAGWVLDPQRIKPGTRMPQTNLGPQELHDLLDYLESLR